MAESKVYATGKRKCSIAKVWITAGKGEISVNDKKADDYFDRQTLKMIIRQPLVLTSKTGSFDIMIRVSGGGTAAQAGAIRHGISKALITAEPELRGVLKKEGFLTRDAREVERKKYGRKKARKNFQFSKR